MKITLFRDGIIGENEGVKVNIVNENRDNNDVAENVNALENMNPVESSGIMEQIGQVA
jgi:hypothetical protein